MGKKTVLISGNFSFPKGNAAGKRVLGLGYIFQDLGYNVVFIGCTPGRTESRIVETRAKYEQFVYYNFNGSRSVRDICNVRKAFEEYKDVASIIGEENLSLVVLYGSPVLAYWVRNVIKFCKKSEIPVIFDCVDWIEKSRFNSIIKNTIKFIDTNYMKRILACRCDGVIVISSYLYDYYKKKGCRTILIPPVGKIEIRDVPNDLNVIYNHDQNAPLRFVYAGSVPIVRNVRRNELKDRIDLTIEIMYELKKKGLNYIFDIFGIEKEQYVTAIPEHELMIEELNSKVYFHGKVDNDMVCRSIKEADFTILNRIVTKVTTAGFPSKVSESMLMGTPVITTATSDITKYIVNGNNGIIISYDTNEAAKQIIEAISDKNTIKKMKRNCLKDNVFDYRKYNDEMIKILQ